MAAVHSVIDYALARRAALAGLRAGRVAPDEVCDAHPYLLRAARHHGEQTDVACPVCRRGRLVHVTYAYGDALGCSSGQARPSAQVAELMERHGPVRVFLVEVCRTCSWNHLVTSYTVASEPATVQASQRQGARRRSAGIRV